MRFTLTRAETRKSFLIGFYLAIEGLVLQVLKSQLFLHKAPPTVPFIVEIFVLYVATGFLFAAVYFNLKNHIPGRSPALSCLSRSQEPPSLFSTESLRGDSKAAQRARPVLSHSSSSSASRRAT